MSYILTVHWILGWSTCVWSADTTPKREREKNWRGVISGKSKIKEEEFDSNAPSQRGKLFLTNLGKIVNEFLIKHFDKIDSYSFTSEINNKLDDVSNGEIQWYDVVDKEKKNKLNNK